MIDFPTIWVSDFRNNANVFFMNIWFIFPIGFLVGLRQSASHLIWHGKSGSHITLVLIRFYNMAASLRLDSHYSVGKPPIQLESQPFGRKTSLAPPSHTTGGGGYPWGVGGGKPRNPRSRRNQTENKRSQRKHAGKHRKTKEVRRNWRKRRKQMTMKENDGNERKHMRTNETEETSEIWALLFGVRGPKGWAGAGVGIGMLWGGGIPVVENKNKVQLFKFL